MTGESMIPRRSNRRFNVVAAETVRCGTAPEEAIREGRQDLRSAPLTEESSLARTDRALPMIVERRPGKAAL